MELTLKRKEQYLDIVEREQSNIKDVYQIFLNECEPVNLETKYLRLLMLVESASRMIFELDKQLDFKTKDSLQKMNDYYVELITKDDKTK